MNKRIGFIAGIVGMSLLVQGCATLNGNVPFHYTPSLSQGDPIDLNVGIKKFVDNRPQADKDATKSIPDIDEKVTAKIIEDFRSSQLFTKLSYPARVENDDIVLSGEIRRFNWKLSTSPLQYIPFLNLVFLFGIPAGNLDGSAQLVVTATDKLGKTLAVYDRTSSKNSTFNIYQGKTGEMGAELGDAFRDVVKQIKDDIYRDAQSGKFKKS
jgi:hypothetical protein